MKGKIGGLLVRGAHVFQAGGNGIAFVGDPKAVRNGLVGYSSRANFVDIDKTPGPQTLNYPADSRVEDCLIHEIGRVEKQVAGLGRNLDELRHRELLQRRPLWT